MDRLKKARTPIRSQLTRLDNEVKPLLALHAPDEEALRVKLDQLETIWTALAEADEKVKDQLLDDDVTEETMEQEYVSIEKYQLTFLTLKNKLKRILNPSVSPTPSEAFQSIDGRGGDKKKTYKLPKIQLMKFSGELKQWLAWWSQFKKIHEDDELDESDKFQYLSQSMDPGTEAMDIVRSYPQSGENYSKAIDALKERYGRDDLQLQYYVRELLNLVVTNVTKKEKLPLPSLYLKLESHLRCLTTLKLDQADPATWLFPLVESSLAEDTLRAWQRSPLSKQDGSALQPPKTRLDLLMDFVKAEVRTEQQISLAQSAFQSASVEEASSFSKSTGKGKGQAAKKVMKEELATAAGLISTVLSCAFCDGKHESDRCVKAQTMSYQEKREKLELKKLCFKCFRSGHGSKKCKCTVKCIICGGKHYPVICQGTNQKKENEGATPAARPTEPAVPTTYGYAEYPPSHSGTVENSERFPKSTSYANKCGSDVLLNTMLVQVRGKDSLVTIRMVGDTGSQRSYVRSDLVRRLGCSKVGEEWIQNVLFGGVTTPPVLSKRYAVTFVKHTDGSMQEFHLLERKEICGQLPRIPNGTWIGELQHKGVTLSDVGNSCSDVDILLGNDYWGTVLTGRLLKLTCGLVAIETIFGWTLSGRIPVVSSNYAVQVSSMLCSTTDISNLWNLEALGIQDPIERKTKEEEEMEATSHFNQTVRRNKSGRYVVALPWKCEKTVIPSNRHVAERRLVRATNQLKKENKYEDYNKVFLDWEKEGFISEVEDNIEGHFLPHRPVFKDESSTPVRPVYDASCKTKGGPSINDMMYTGPNLLELIPSLILRFREKKIGISADIRKAFQMIEVDEEDQNFQKFLWWEDSSCNKVKIYQHHRVVFGMTCSPFLLASTINYHLSGMEDRIFAKKLRTSFYVDNCVCSVSTYADYEQLRTKAVSILKDAGMELRQWAPSLLDDDVIEQRPVDFAPFNTRNDTEEKVCISLLGLLWDRREDELYCDVPSFDNDGKTTKRIILSFLARIFDHVGFTSPATLELKLILQDAVSLKCGWDDPLPDELAKKFITWGRSAQMLREIKIPRHCQLSSYNSRQVHVFVDGSSYAYACVILLRTEGGSGVKVQLILAKSRLSPTSGSSRKATIPRLELMSCLLGSRLAKTVREALDWEEDSFHFWSDSTTALAWIRRHDQWGTFVGNRVTEIRSHTDPTQWRHVPGIANPADLPSRGCSPSQLLQSRWWEGQSWLYEPPSSWPNFEEEINEEAVNAEKRKSVVIVATEVFPEPRFSTFKKNVAVWGWVLRFLKCVRLPESQRSSIQTNFLRVEEMRNAERVILREIQQQCFPSPGRRIGGMMVTEDENGLLRVQTRLLHRQDENDFIRPVILPKCHPLVDMLIGDIHQYYGHAGTQFVISKLREKYWVLQTRRTVQRVLRRCVICRRFQSQPSDVEPAPLPEKRVSNSEPFETTGVDLAGPLTLRDGSKAWIVLFTCAFYRCLHLDVVTSLSTEAFLGSLERFISLYGRPNTVYSDNGTNFRGAVNLFRKLNWEQIEEESKVRQIQWIFNPATAAWYGGFWERLVRSVKDLLKRMLGTARLTYDELRTCLARVCVTINERPLTVVTEDNEDLIPLTPAMFLRRKVSGVMPEVDHVRVLQARYRKMKEIHVQLQDRFRKEYLALLVQKGNEKKKKPLKPGDVVLVGADNRKRFQWPLGVILSLIPGRDGNCRIARVKTSHGILVRPLQRLFNLEVSGGDEIADRLCSSRSHEDPVAESATEKAATSESERVVLRSGRVVRKPARYGQYFNF